MTSTTPISVEDFYQSIPVQSYSVSERNRRGFTRSIYEMHDGCYDLPGGMPDLFGFAGTKLSWNGQDGYWLDNFAPLPQTPGSNNLSPFDPLPQTQNSSSYNPFEVPAPKEMTEEEKKEAVNNYAQMAVLEVQNSTMQASIQAGKINAGLAAFDRIVAHYKKQDEYKDLSDEEIKAIVIKDCYPTLVQDIEANASSPFWQGVKEGVSFGYADDKDSSEALEHVVNIPKTKGARAANTLGGIASGAVAGAVIGTFFGGPGIGTAIGAVVGGFVAFFR